MTPPEREHEVVERMWQWWCTFSPHGEIPISSAGRCSKFKAKEER